MKRYSSTLLKIFNTNCPAALGFFESHVPYDRDVYQVGIAAHACMQYVLQKEAREYPDQQAVCDAVVYELTHKGRSFNNVPEPPMSPDQATQGRDIALFYLRNNELPQNLVLVEGGLGMNSRGEPCGYDDPECRYGAIIDNMFSETVGDEDFAADILTISDWKSAWPTNETELETLQRKGQAVLGWLHYGAGYQGVRQQVVNLRTGVPYSKDIYFDDQGIETLKRWREDILDACAAADLTREARPGAGCLTCRYLTECPDQLAAYSGDGVNQVEQYVALEAVRTSLAKQIRVNTRTESIAVPGGIVGYKIQTKKIPTDGALDELLEHWFPAISEGEPVDIGELRGLLRALDLPASSYEKAAKVLYPDEGNAGFEDMVAACVTTKNESRFGITTTE